MVLGCAISRRYLKEISAFEATRPRVQPNDLLGTVRRALRVLDLFVESRGPLSPRAIASRLGLNISSVYHLLNTLTHDGYVIRDPATARYALGAKVPRLYAAYVDTLGSSPRLSEIVQRLAAETHESAYLALYRAGQVVVAEIVESTQAVRVATLYVGYSENLHARALGKAVLAHVPAEAVAAHFAAEPPRQLTRRTLVELDAIEAELRRVAAHGYAEDLEEFAEGVCCAAAPFFGHDGLVAGALAISQPHFRYQRECERIVDAVRRAAHDASAALGYSGAPAVASRVPAGG